MKLIDLYCGLGGWSKGFMLEGWDCVGYDLNPQPKYPAKFIQANVLDLTAKDLLSADFITASSPCEQFSVHCMKHFHPNPKWPELGIKLFNHTRQILEESGKPYVMENVRCAEKFVGKATNHCGPFYLWGNAVPGVFPPEFRAIIKGVGMGTGAETHGLSQGEKRQYRKRFPMMQSGSKSKERAEFTASVAQIPLELSRYIAQCATRLLEIPA